jgi:hypothetical protein
MKHTAILLCFLLVAAFVLPAAAAGVDLVKTERTTEPVIIHG